MTTRILLSIEPLGFPWKTIDPFLFCVHRNDAYPRGNALQGPDAPLTGRNLGQAFTDYRRTEFGGWPWGVPDPVHPRASGRFARHADGRVENPT
jgi:hypothetical protein